MKDISTRKGQHGFEDKSIVQDGDGENSKLFTGIKGVIQLGQNLPKIALCVTIFKKNDIFHFRQNSEKSQFSEVLEE